MYLNPKVGSLGKKLDTRWQLRIGQMKFNTLQYAAYYIVQTKYYIHNKYIYIVYKILEIIDASC